MANPEHFQTLKQGVEAWNAWRLRARNIKPDLSEADLNQTDLTWADFLHTNLALTQHPCHQGQ